MTIAAKGNEKAIWAMVIADRLKGQIMPEGQPIRAKNTIIATPMQISGITMGSAMPPS